MSVSAYFTYFLLGYLALTLFFYALAFLSVPKTPFIARSLAAYISLVTCAIGGVISSAALTIAGHQQIAQWVTARSFHYLMRYTTGVEFVIEDPNDYLSKTRPAVFIGNHQTELDVLMLGAIFPKYCSVTAKSSLKSVPFLGWFMTLSGSIFIDRKSSKDARQAMQGAANEITRKKQSVYMFPEGTRSYAKEPLLLPFKKGAFHLAVEAGVPIVPVVVANYSHILNLRKWVFNAGKVPIKVLKPIPTKGITAADVDDLARETRQNMLSELVKLSSKAQGKNFAMPVEENGSKATTTGADVKKRGAK